MLDEARARLDRFGDRVTFQQSDLGRELAPELRAGSLDAVFSTGTFHWVIDHPGLYRQLFALLAPGGCLVAQCGGEGSISEVRGILDHLGIDWSSLNRYAAASETVTWLRQAGFVDAWAWLSKEPVGFHGREALVDYLVGGALGPYLAGRPDEDQRAVTETVADRMAEPVLHFVRLNVLARRP